MGIGLAGKFAIKNLKANKIFVIPFILSSSIMIALFNIMQVLMRNDYVNHSFSSLPPLMGMGVIIIGIFSFMFIIYANRFMVKRRNKEFSLYRIMGLEKKHIVRIMFIEEIIIFLFISIISILGGYVIGKLIFLFVNKLIQNDIVSLTKYYFSYKAAIYTMVYIGIIFVVIFITNTRSISTSSPIELLSKQYSGEKEPKSRYLLTIIGLIVLAAGYFLAITTKGNLNSLGMFFVAAVLVILATYILFVTLSIVVLKMLKSNKNRYYKADNFISISGMIYRMKGNALGLASIAVLCTGVIITLSTTFAIYSNMHEIVKSVMPREYKIEMIENISPENTEKIGLYRKELKNIVDNSVENKNEIKDAFVREEIYLPVTKDGDKILSRYSKSSKNAKNIFIILNKDHDFGESIGKDIHLGDDEVMYSVNNKIVGGFENVEINGKKMKAVEDKKNIVVPGSIAIETIKFVVNPKVFDEMSKAYSDTKASSGQLGSASESISIFWDVKSAPQNYYRNLSKKIDSSKMKLSNEESQEKSLRELYGGILFLGLVIGAIFIIGTVLITYYKQLSEGYEDRRKYQIMKKVGLPDELIKKTAEKQIIWMFFIPLAVALIHSLVASKIVYQLLQLFGITSYMFYVKNIGIVIVAFSIVYLVIFKITSNVYYRIVK